MNEAILLKQAATEAREARKYGQESASYLQAIQKLDAIVSHGKPVSQIYFGMPKTQGMYKCLANGKKNVTVKNVSP
jgi:hypothetical protein